jgi:UDP-N-acetylmuramate dehydrogenase
MDEGVAQLLRERFGERVAFGIPMARVTSFRVGGPAECVVHVQNVDDLGAALALARAHRLPVTLLGAGSNLLVRDGGIPGVILSFTQGFRAMGVRKEGEREAVLWAEAGVKINQFLAFAQRSGWSGLEFLAGTPGTMGGAVVMNAGVAEREVKDALRELAFMAPDGTLHRRPREALDFRYRGVDLPEDSIICEMDFAVTRSEPAQVKAEMMKLLTRRKSTQPLSLPNAGSIFKNPPGDYAGRLIEKVGLKGARAGDAQISELHANFIVNLGRARAADILSLIDRARRRVHEATGVTLETEVRIVGVEASLEGQ